MIRIRPETASAFDAIDADISRIKAIIRGAPTPDTVARAVQMMQRIGRNAHPLAMLLKGEIADSRRRDQAEQEQRRTA